METKQTKKCPYCGEEVLEEAKKCRYCNEWLDEEYRERAELEKRNVWGVKHKDTLREFRRGKKKSRTVAVLLAFFLGFIGIHKFYLAQAERGVVYMLLSWMLVPWIFAICEGFYIMTMSEEKFNKKYY